MRALPWAGTAQFSKRLAICCGGGLLAMISAGGFACAQTTVTVGNNNVTSTAGVGFNLLALGTASTTGFQSSATLTTLSGGGLPTPAGTEITKVVFADSASDRNISGVYAGSKSGEAESPIASTSLLKYLVAEGSSTNVGTVTVSYSVPQTSLQILWGTIGSGDTLTVCANTGCTGTALATFTGTTMIGDGAVANQNAAITIKGLPGFSTIQLSNHNSKPAFEFLLGQPIPEPASLTALGMGLAGLAVARWRAKKAVQKVPVGPIA